MIKSAEEFVALRSSDVKLEYDRAAQDEASLEVWNAVIEGYPEYRKWVAHNKTVPVEILAKLSEDDTDVRVFVAMKRRLPRDLFERLSKDPEATVRQTIAANAKTPIEILRSLVTDEDEDVARIAKFNLRERE